jgi:starch synthase
MIAMALGSAVVATEVGDLPDVIVNGHTGVICKPEVDDMSSAISALLVKPHESKRLAENALRFATTECSWEEIARRACTIYRDLIAEAR